ncbi:MAG: hypothetical protein WCC48_09980 [Anaeromyxobacteraceae bacterium]
MIWGSLLLGVLLMAGVAAFVGPALRAEQYVPFPDAFPVSAALVNVVLLAAARFIPRALKPDAPPLTKNVVATAMSEAGALYAAVAWMLTGNRHAVAGLVMGLGGIAVCFPNDARWRVLGGLVEEDRPGGDRSGGPGFGGARR